MVGFCLFAILDSIRDIHKYMMHHHNLDLRAVETARSTTDMKMFRAQRNYYICGFTLFLWMWVGHDVCLPWACVPSHMCHAPACTVDW